MNGKTGPWIRVGVPANMLERWRHSANVSLRPAAQSARGAGNRGPGGYIRTYPPGRGRLSARSAFRARTMARTMTRRRYKGRGRRRIKKWRIGRLLQPWSFARRLTTAMYLSLNPAAGTLSSAQLYLNSAFDPMGGSSATAQPLAFQQYKTLYKRYCVVSWAIEVAIVSTDNTNPVVVGFTPTPQTSALTQWSHFKECPGTVQTVITPDIDRSMIRTRGGVKRWLLPKGGKLLSEESVTALCTGDPARLLLGYLYAQAMDGSADPAAVHLSIKLTQLVVFFDPVIPSRSTQ